MKSIIAWLHAWCQRGLRPTPPPAAVAEPSPIDAIRAVPGSATFLGDKAQRGMDLAQATSVTSPLTQWAVEIGFGDGERTQLAKLHSTLRGSLPEIAADAGDVGFSWLPDDTDPAQRHCSLIDWMTSGLAGPWDEEFYRRRIALSQSFVERGVSYGALVATISRIRSAYVRRITAVLPVDQAIAAIGAIGKLLDLELAIIGHGHRHRAEQQFAAQQQRFWSDQRVALETLSSGLAHGLRNPLNAAKLQLDLLARRLHRRNADPELSEPAEIAHRELQRMTSLVSEFLAFARPSLLELVDGDVAAIAARAIEGERGLADERGVELVSTVTPAGLQALVDPSKMSQVLQNLLRNAIEATARGGRVELRIALDRGEVHIHVDDDGRGISEGVLARMYDPFYSTKHDGTGLGMSIVQSLVALHGGSIEVASSSAGTRCHVVLPQPA